MLHDVLYTCSEARLLRGGLLAHVTLGKQSWLAIAYSICMISIFVLICLHDTGTDGVVTLFMFSLILAWPSSSLYASLLLSISPPPSLQALAAVWWGRKLPVMWRKMDNMYVSLSGILLGNIQWVSTHNKLCMYMNCSVCYRMYTFGHITLNLMWPHKYTQFESAHCLLGLWTLLCVVCFVCVIGKCSVSYVEP